MEVKRNIISCLRSNRLINVLCNSNIMQRPRNNKIILGMRNSRIMLSLRHSKTVLRNFLLVASVLFMILSLSTLLIYHYSKSILQKELIHTNETIAVNVTQSMDDLIRQMQHVTASLSTSKMVQLYFSSDNSKDLFNAFRERITEQINAYVYGFDYIDSIYIYSPSHKSYITSAGELPIDSLKDNDWITMLPEPDSRISFLSRKINGSYPFVLSIINHSVVAGRDGYVVLNLNLRKLPNILQADTASGAYIVTNQGRIMYRKSQEDILEPLSLYPELSGYIPSKNSFSSFVDDPSAPYIYTQVPSARYDWNYITVTYLQEYTSRLSQLKSTLLLIFFLLLLFLVVLSLLLSTGSYKPILKLVNLLNNPESWNSSQMDEQDINEIARKIVAYVQTNTRLSEELQHRLSLLNRTQLIALQSQINPHFVGNTLNLIHCAIVQSLGHEHLAVAMTLHLSRLMNYALDSSNSLVTVQEEFRYTELYLDILKARYHNRLQVEVKLDPDTAGVRIPKLILQPLIENCIHHGVGKRLEYGFTIRVESERKITHVQEETEDIIIIRIVDNGVGISPEKLMELNEALHGDVQLTSTHVGLKNVASRLRLLYGELCSIELTCIPPAGTCVSLFFPASE